MSASNHGQAGPDDARCYNCGLLGHWTVACPEPTRETPAGLVAWRNSSSGVQNQARDYYHQGMHKKQMPPVITKYGPPSQPAPPPPQYPPPGYPGPQMSYHGGRQPPPYHPAGPPYHHPPALPPPPPPPPSYGPSGYPPTPMPYNHLPQRPPSYALPPPPGPPPFSSRPPGPSPGMGQPPSRDYGYMANSPPPHYLPQQPPNPPSPRNGPPNPYGQPHPEQNHRRGRADHRQGPPGRQNHRQRQRNPSSQRVKPAAPSPPRPPLRSDSKVGSAPGLPLPLAHPLPPKPPTAFPERQDASREKQQSGQKQSRSRRRKNRKSNGKNRRESREAATREASQEGQSSKQQDPTKDEDAAVSNDGQESDDQGEERFHEEASPEIVSASIVDEESLATPNPPSNVGEAPDEQESNERAWVSKPIMPEQEQDVGWNSTQGGGDMTPSVPDQGEIVLSPPHSAPRSTESDYKDSLAPIARPLAHGQDHDASQNGHASLDERQRDELRPQFTKNGSRSFDTSRQSEDTRDEVSRPLKRQRSNELHYGNGDEATSRREEPRHHSFSPAKRRERSPRGGRERSKSPRYRSRSPARREIRADLEKRRNRERSPHGSESSDLSSIEAELLGRPKKKTPKERQQRRREDSRSLQRERRRRNESHSAYSRRW